MAPKRLQSPVGDNHKLCWRNFVLLPLVIFKQTVTFCEPFLLWWTLKSGEPHPPLACQRSLWIVHRYNCWPQIEVDERIIIHLSSIVLNAHCGKWSMCRHDKWSPLKLLVTRSEDSSFVRSTYYAILGILTLRLQQMLLCFKKVEIKWGF